jgi:hypothetical protein
MSASDRLDEVWLEGRRALDNQRSVLKFIDDGKPAAELRVSMVNSVIVSVVSTVEEILRQLFIEYLSEVEKKIDSHKKLRGKLREANAEKTIDELRRALKEKNEAEAVKLLDGLRRCLVGEAGYRLAKESITNNKGNFRSEQLTDISKNIGLVEVWTKISSHETILEFTGAPTAAMCQNDIIARWNSIYDERDTVVHRISQASGWGPSTVNQAIDLFLILVDRFKVCLTEDLISILPFEAD